MPCASDSSEVDMAHTSPALVVRSSRARLVREMMREEDLVREMSEEADEV